ncbi:tetratricopeptide repeat protein [Anaeromicropila herbilytica]|uniref:Tetratricopeptide repeat protein n=1 Tax=Anaeromicropila herbilytica TaxID=2785025 RepID=A0A7R7EJX7_9FIRM|nr:tetratricopeptide repeat protein [Anaeromicropila herbilytica]BCN30129.1 hypothetical protein bsdtb5_14240 [Anaeromicropila herbilytica]
MFSKRKTIQLAISIVTLCIAISGCSLNKNAKYYYKEGMKYFNEENYKKAEENLEIAVTKDKNKAEYVLGHAFSLIKIGDYSEAINQFSKVILDKNNKIVLENNKKAYRGIGIAYFESSDYKKAYEAFNKSIDIKEMNDLNLDITYYIAKCEERLGLYKAAVKSYTTLIKEDKEDIKNYCSRAYSYEKLKENEKALSDYNKAIKLDKKNYDVYFLKYFFVLNTKGTDEAKEVLQDALNIKSKESNSYNQGKIYYYLGDYKKAESKLQKALKEKNDNANFYLGEIAFGDKDYNKAIKYYESYIGNNSVIKSGTAYNQLGVSYLTVENYEKALLTFQNGVRLGDPETIKTLKYNEIVAYEKLIQFDKALVKMKDYLAKYPNDESAQKEYEFIKTRVQ